jgi:hypothetical protein
VTGRRKGVAFGSSAATGLAWLAASMVMGMFAMHLANMLNMMAMVSVVLVLFNATTLFGVRCLGFLFRVAVVVFHGLHFQVHFGFVDALHSGLNFATGLAVMFTMVSVVMFSGVVRLTAMLVVMCLMTFHRSTP